jgi:hypothetical protein
LGPAAYPELKPVQTKTASAMTAKLINGVVHMSKASELERELEIVRRLGLDKSCALEL